MMASNRGYSQSIQYNEKLIQDELKRMRCVISKRNTQYSIWIIGRLFAHLLEGIHVDRKNLLHIKSQAKLDRRTKYIFVPLYKSYADQLILHYVNHYYDIEPGFQFANFEDAAHIRFFDELMKRIGVI